MAGSSQIIRYHQGTKTFRQIDTAIVLIARRLGREGSHTTCCGGQQSYDRSLKIHLGLRDDAQRACIRIRVV